jgi:outer membrane murein-binding lipoprotein Lpp
MPAVIPIMIGLSVAGTVTSVYGGIKQGKAEKAAGEAQKRAAESQAELLDFNATIADAQAKDAEARGQIEADRYRTSVKGLIGHQRAATAAGNIDVGFGSALDVQADAAYLGELDALTIEQNAAREAWGYRVDAYDTRKRAEITRKEGVMMEAAGRQRASASYIGALGAGLSGASQVTGLLGQRYGFNRPGA